MDNSLFIRRAGEADIGVLVDFRLEMFRAMGWTDEGRLVELAERYDLYVRAAMVSRDFVGWIAELDGEAVGSVAVLWEVVPPTVRNLSGRQAYILALYVVPAARHRGIATQLLETAVGYAREEGADVVSLHYSPAGRSLYERFGFASSPEMRLFTDPDSASWAPVAPAHTDADDAD
ncbi:MAG: GNAT family N-acetyltransferase [Coriobacteriia bacterium]|nr:GNAT family N-acetyltransferase [Coriobacteriia bacterium]